MGKITDLTVQKRKNTRVNVFVDGRFMFAITQAAAWEANLAIGQEISRDNLQKLSENGALDISMSKAMHYLAARPRSEKELRDRLMKHKIEDSIIQKTVERLRARGLLNDQVFTRYWIDQRVTFKPRSSLLLEMELRGKGIDPDIISEATSNLDDKTEAFKAAQRKAKTILRNDYNRFYKKLMTHLRTRGFGYSTTSEAIKAVWTQLEAEGKN